MLCWSEVSVIALISPVHRDSRLANLANCHHREQVCWDLRVFGTKGPDTSYYDAMTEVRANGLETAGM